MALFIAATGLNACCGPGAARHKSQAEFIAWWKVPHFETAALYRFSDLLPSSLDAVGTPAPIEHQDQVGYVYEIPNESSFLAIPHKRLEPLNEGCSGNSLARFNLCEDDHSWLIVGDERRWVPIDFNPYCSLTYGDEDLSINFFYFANTRRPLIEITTNGPACVPHYLYGWDESVMTYKQLGYKCE